METRIWHKSYPAQMPFEIELEPDRTVTALFEQAASPYRAQEQLRAWQERVCQSGLHCFDDFLNTLNRWGQEITNYFVNRHSSGFVEGLNNKLKVLKRRCYGLFNLDHLFQRIFLDLEGYRLFT